MYIWLNLWYNTNRKINMHAHACMCIRVILINGRISRRVIEAVITRRSWKPFESNLTWVRISHPPPILWNCISHISQNFANFLQTFYLLALQFISRNGMTDSQFESSVHTRSKTLNALIAIIHITKHAHFSSNIESISKR